MNRQAVTSNVKDTELVAKRRRQIIKASIQLFKEKGFHRTTTREIATKAGFSIGTLYEYVRSKEEVLFLVYESIHDIVYNHLESLATRITGTKAEAVSLIRAYFRLMDQMQEEVLILYQEVKSLHVNMREQVLHKEREMVALMKSMIMGLEEYSLDENEAELLANNIFVQGHMWCFRRWTLHKQFTLESYTDMQIKLMEGSLKGI